MTYELVTVKCGGPGVHVPGYEVIHEWENCLDNYWINSGNEDSPCVSYQGLLEECQSDWIWYIHDDVTIHDSKWASRICSVAISFPDCVCIGFGGASRLGHPDLYKSRYQLSNLARGGYISNQTDWQIHGGHEEGDKRVAVVDAFFMAIRVSFLNSIGGWPIGRLTHHCLDLWLACEAARQKKEVWMTGVSCTHHGGGSSTKPVYAKAKWLQGGTLETDHRIPHRWLYDEYVDVLPIEVAK